MNNKSCFTDSYPFENIKTCPYPFENIKNVLKDYI